MARPNVYTIQLTDDECSKLNKTIKNKSTCKTFLKRCRILRELDQKYGSGLTHAQIACAPAPDGHSRWTIRLLVHPSKRKRRIRSLHGGYS